MFKLSTDPKQVEYFVPPIRIISIKMFYLCNFKIVLREEFVLPSQNTRKLIFKIVGNIFNEGQILFKKRSLIRMINNNNRSRTQCGTIIKLNNSLESKYSVKN